MGVEVKHRSDQVLELLVEESVWLPVRVSRPELLRAVGGDEFVMRVLEVGHVKRRVTCVQDKQDDAESKQIDDLALVSLLGVDLGSHEAKRSYDTAVHTISGAALNGTREAEIDHFDVVHLV